MRSALRSLTLLSLAGLLAAPLVDCTCPPPKVGPPPGNPFDLVGDGRDPNGLRRNPRWRTQEPAPGGQGFRPAPFQKDEKSAFSCEAVDAINEHHATGPELCFDTTDAPRQGALCSAFAPGRLPGHANWVAATFTGSATAHLVVSPDGDYEFELEPDGNAGLLQGRGRIHLEFDGAETCHHFQSEWWKYFCKYPGHDLRAPLLHRWMRHRRAIVTGLFNIDVEHYKVELHPVWAAAFDVGDAARKDEAAWAIFARRQGNEGACSRFSYGLPIGSRRYFVDLPWRESADPQIDSVCLGPRTKLRASRDGAAPVQIEYVRGKGVRVGIDLPGGDPATSFVEGELHLLWRRSSDDPCPALTPAPDEPTPPPPPPPAATALLDDDEDEGAESTVMKEMRTPDPEAQHRMKANVDDRRRRLPVIGGASLPVEAPRAVAAFAEPPPNDGDACSSRRPTDTRTRLLEQQIQARCEVDPASIRSPELREVCRGAGIDSAATPGCSPSRRRP